MNPMKSGDKLADHARPMVEVLGALTEMKRQMERMQRHGVGTSGGGNGDEQSGRIVEIEDSG